MKTQTFNIDLSGIDEEVQEVMRQAYEADLLEEALEAEKLLQQLGKQHETKVRAVDGLGPQTISAPPILHTLANLQGEDFADPGYAQHMAKRYPAIQVNAGGVKECQVGFERQVHTDATTTETGNRKFHKNYG